MMFLIYRGEVEEFDTMAEVNRRAIEIVEDDGDEEVEEMTVIEGNKCTVEIDRKIIIKPPVHAIKVKRVKEDAKKK